MAKIEDYGRYPNRIRERRHNAGLSQQQLADRVGTTKGTIDKLEKGGIRLDIEWMLKLSPILGIDPTELLPKNDTRGVALPGGEAVLAPPQITVDPRDLIPIRSAGRGGDEQEMFLGDGPLGMTQRPRNLLGVRGAYAIYMLGESMEPRYRQGWLLHVNPVKPPARGRDVVVVKTNNAVLIKEFVGWQGGRLVVQALNPPNSAPIRIPRDEVSDCHLIVGCDQE